MACKREVLGCIIGVQEVISYLSGQTDSTETSNAMEDDTGWQDNDPASWGWGDEDAMDTSQSAAEPAPAAGGGGGDPDWLDAATVAVSPLGDVLAAATDRRVVLLAGQWDSESGQSRFVVSARLEAPEASVTSLLCLPLASNQRSSSGAADWTCLVVGQESGHLTFYTEDGSLLFRQRLHESAVLSVSCSSRQVSPAADEELTVVFEDAVVVVDGFSLYQTLRACRNQLARVRAGGGGGLDVPPLARSKWELRLQQRTETAQNVGHRSTALLDHLLQQSLHRPASNVTNAAVPAGALLVTTGRCPFVGFYHAAEGVEQARLDQVFRGVASKVKDTVFSTIGSFWSSGSGQRDPAKEQEELEPGKPIDCKFGLPDVQRQGQLMVLSRDRQLSAVTDSFGRVTLIDNHSGVALHMWKGYRDAECGWLEVRESRSSSARRPAPGQDAPPARRTRFLALYAPRRGLLEVWSAVGGPKVAAFNVSKHGRLVNVSHGLIGVSEGDGAARKAPKLLQCVFLSSDGRLSTLNVPFHLALSERSSRRAHGQHLLRELRAQLRAPPADAAGYLRSQLAALRTASARHQAMDAALACRRLTAGDMEAAVDAVLDAYTAQEPASLDHDSQALLQTAMAYRRLLTAYCTLEKMEAAPPPYQQPEDEISTQELSELLRLSPERTAELVSRLDPAPGSPEAEEPRARVTFAAERRAGPAAFLACLEVTAPHGQPAVGVRETLTEDERRELATLLFGACLSLPAPSPEWRSAVLRCGVPAAQLLRLLAACWLDCCAPLRPRHLAGLAATLTAVVAETGQSWSRSNSTSSTSANNGSGGNGGGALLWQTVQEQITEATELRRALTLATVCRAVAVRMEEERYAATLEKRFGKAAEAGEDVPEPTPSETVSGDWEQLTEQTVSWDLLLDQLSDVSALCDVIPAAHRGSDVTLRALLKKGPGAVSEIAARWLLEIGAEPVDLAPPPPPPATDADQEAPPEDASEAAAPATAKEAKKEERAAEWGREATEPDTEEGRRRQRIQDCVSRIAARFPHSVRADTLLLNAAWEEAAAWNRHREHTDRLSRAVSFAAHIGNAHLRYGACCLLWSALVCRPCATVAGLLQRAGRRPDDTLCRREVQLPQLQLPQLMDACSELLEQLLKALVTSEVERAPVLYSDNLWAAAAARTDSLLDMAARQRPCSEDLAALQLQAADVMRAQVHLDLRGVHPYGCFTERDGSLLFGELSARYTPPSAVDQSVRSRREALLNRWVTAAVGLIAERPDGQAELGETAQWVRRCREVARGWDISVDVVNRQYTLDLYSAGHDHAAQEVLLSLGSAAGLPSQLLLLAGARVRHYIHSSSDMMPLLARLTMNCADFIKIADVPLQCPSVPLERTLALLRHVVRLEPDSASECRLAMEMVDLTESLMSDSDKGKR